MTRTPRGKATGTEAPGDGGVMQRPLIVTFDARGVAERLESRRFNVTSGTFGLAFPVVPHPELVAVRSQAVAPGLSEADIVVADLAVRKTDQTAALSDPTVGVRAIWASARYGMIDPRPLGMSRCQDKVDRVLRHGGPVVLVADAQDGEFYTVATRTYGGHTDKHEMPRDNWSLTSATSRFTVENEVGRTLTPTRTANELGLGDSSVWAGHFTCTFQPPQDLQDRWFPLATNKFGATVAGVLRPQKDSTDGWIVILPRLDDVESLVVDLIERVFPIVAPTIYPELATAAWTSDPTYEHDDVVALRTQVGEIEAQAAAKVVAIEEEIAAARERQQHLHTLLTGTDDELVEAIITTLGDLGFGNVVDIDAEREAAGDTGDKREDVRIGETGKPLVLGEVKGIAGLPKEANALQVWKYLTPRMKELKRTDIRGLSIVNQQRDLPPLEREHKNVFQNDVLTTADANEITLMTTWELYRLSRNATRHGWPFEAVRDLFYTDGRVDIVPSHYDEIGVVEEVWPKSHAFAVTLTAPLAAATTIAVEGPIDFEELADVSIMLDDESVSDASTGQKVGVGLQALPDVVKRGRRLFAVRPLPRAAASGDEVDGDS